MNIFYLQLSDKRCQFSSALETDITSSSTFASVSHVQKNSIGQYVCENCVHIWCDVKMISRQILQLLFQKYQYQ